MFSSISQPDKLIWKVHRPKSKSFIRGASPDISYELWYKDAIGGKKSNSATQERKDVEVEIATFVVKEFAKLTVPRIDII